MDTMSDKSLRILIVVLGLLLCWVITLHGKNESKIQAQQSEITRLQNQNDSLRSELFPIEIELGRYQVAFEIFSERNPKAAEQYGTIISQETE